MNVTPENALESRCFIAEAEQVLLRVRGSFGHVVDALPGHITRPHELAAALDLDMKLAWKIVKVAHQADLFHLPRHIPGTAAVDQFLRAAARHRVPAIHLDAVRVALAEYQRLVDEHAGDRATLEKMFISYAREGRAELDLAQRKAAFEANSYLWGVQARTQIFVDIFHPGAVADRLDIVALRGFIGLRRIRPGVSWMISRLKVSDDRGGALGVGPREPLDAPQRAAEEDAASVPLLRPFCSQPVPRFRRVPGPGGFFDDLLMPGDVGNVGEVTCLTGEIVRNAASSRRSPENCWAATCTLARTPCEALVIDWFVHRGLFGTLAPEVGIYSELNGGPLIPPLDGRERDRLPSFDTITYLGRGLAAIATPHIPNHAAVVHYAFERAGWPADEFDGYRVQIQYPVIPTSVLVKQELPNV